MCSYEPEVIIRDQKGYVKRENKLLGIAISNCKLYNEAEVISMYAERIRALRQQAGLSQQELGSRLGVSAVAVGKWERGQTQPDIRSLTIMADLFGTTIDDLCDHNVAAAGEENGSIQVMTRAFRQLTPEEQEKYIAVGRALFAHAFGRVEGEKP